MGQKNIWQYILRMRQGDLKVIQFSERSCPERHKAPSKGSKIRASVGFSARFARYFFKACDY